MAHGIAGNAGAVSLIAGAALNGKLRSWRARPSTKWVDDTGAGEGADSNVFLRGSWEVEVRGFVPNTTLRHVINANEAGLGGIAAISLKHKTTDTSPFFTATGGYRDLEIGADVDGVVEFTLTVFCTEGTMPTFNTSPA